MAKNGARLGNTIAPPRFLLFGAIATVGTAMATGMIGWRHGVMAGFDVAAVVFLLSLAPLLDDKSAEIRSTAKRNDANRTVLLVLTVGVMLVILAAIASELGEEGGPQPVVVALIVATLTLAWLFSNIVYTLHYAHLYYMEGPDGGDAGGLSFPKTDEPDYWDILYFAFTMGMTFQTSDVQIESGRIRRVAMLHGLIAFVFNLGVLAFTVNVLGGR